MLADILAKRADAKGRNLSRAEIERETVLWRRAEEARLLRDARLKGRSRERDDLKWYVVFTNPLCERRVERGLLGLGLCAYLPEGRRWFRPRRGTIVGAWRHAPRVAFPRYLFVSFPTSARPDLRIVDGVAGIVGSGGRLCEPVLIDSADIAAIRQAQEIGQLDFGKNPTVYEMGQEVEILHPLMKGMRGVVASGRIDGGYRIDIPGWLSTAPILSVDFLREAA